MKTSLISRAAPLIVSAILGAIVTQVGMLSMQIHSQTILSAPIPKVPASNLCLVPINDLETTKELGADIDELTADGWIVRASYTNKLGTVLVMQK